MKIHRDIAGVEYWWNPYVRAWYAATVDSEGNLGESVNAYTRDEIRQIAKRDLESKPASPLPPKP